jgi:hypothetical protein
MLDSKTMKKSKLNLRAIQLNNCFMGMKLIKIDNKKFWSMSYEFSGSININTVSYLYSTISSSEKVVNLECESYS